MSRMRCTLGVDVPVEFAMAQRVRNLGCCVLDPGSSIRRWFVAEK